MATFFRKFEIDGVNVICKGYVCLLSTVLWCLFAGMGWCAERTLSGPIVINGQAGTVISNVHITSTTGDCIRIQNSSNITIENSDIGPCGTAGGAARGNGITLSNTGNVYIFDNYIHPETASSQCCDYHDGIFGSGGNQNVTIQGNVIAYGETNIEFTGQNDSIVVTGNFLLNPRGPNPRGQNFQCYGSDPIHTCSNVRVNNNYTLAGLDTTRYLYSDNQEDSINFGIANQATVRNNYIAGGHSRSGCGIIADDRANNMQFQDNLLVNTGQCGIGIANGINPIVTGNRIYNTTPVPKGGNTAIYVWNQYSGKCGPATISSNVADMVLRNGGHNAYWNGGGCSVTSSGNIFNAAADSQLTPVSSVFPAPPIPPQPKNCIATSPYTTNTSKATGLPPCS